MKQIKAVLFDLDGTIINSEEGITKCVQYALRAKGIEEPDRNETALLYRTTLEPGFRERYGMTEEEAWQSVQKYRERFDVKGIFECALYEYVKDVIGSLKKKGYVVALASSKPETACRRILEHFELTAYFDMIVGSTLDGSISTKEEVLLELCRRLEAGIDNSVEDTVWNFKPDEMCLIGDTKYDAIGAQAVGIRCIGVSYGFGTTEELMEAGAEAVFDDIREVENYIENNKEL